MHELLFRGQQRRKGEKVYLDGSPVESSWFYGNGVLQGKGDFSIIYQTEPMFEKHSVYTDTLGRYTGLTDKNGKKIFEGDIIIAEHDKSAIAVVKYNESKAAFYVENKNAEDYLGEAWDTDVVVIGNIYDNPELLKGE